MNNINLEEQNVKTDKGGSNRDILLMSATLYLEL